MSPRGQPASSSSSSSSSSRASAAAERAGGAARATLVVAVLIGFVFFEDLAGAALAGRARLRGSLGLGAAPEADRVSGGDDDQRQQLLHAVVPAAEPQAPVEEEEEALLPRPPGAVEAPLVAEAVEAPVEAADAKESPVEEAPSVAPLVAGTAGGTTEGGGWESAGRLPAAEDFGDLEAEGALAAAAKARAWRRELVLVVAADAEGEDGALAVNLVETLRVAGVEHVLVVARDAAACAKLVAHPYGIACGWSSSVGAGRAASHDAASLLRWRLVAALARAGYGVLAPDLRSVVLQNPYPTLKAAFSQYAVVGMRQDNAATAIHTGMVYVQSASEDGALWVLDEAVRRLTELHAFQPPESEAEGTKSPLLGAHPTHPVAWADTAFAAEGSVHRREHVVRSMLSDLAVVNDALESACAGIEVHRHSVRMAVGDEKRPDWWKATDALLGNLWTEHPDKEVWAQAQGADAPTRYLEGADRPQMKTCKLRKSGDRLAVAPGWMFGGWIHGTADELGVSGWWNARPPPTLVGNFDGVGSRAEMRLVLRAIRMWSPLAERAYGAGSHGSGLLVLDTSVVHATVADLEKDVIALIRIAAAASLTPAVPPVPCTAPWIDKDDQHWKGISPPYYAPTREPTLRVGRASEDTDEPRCYWVPYEAWPGCAQGLALAPSYDAPAAGAPTLELPAAADGAVAWDDVRAKLPTGNPDVVVLKASGPLPELVGGAESEAGGRADRLLRECRLTEEARERHTVSPGPPLRGR